MTNDEIRMTKQADCAFTSYELRHTSFVILSSSHLPVGMTGVEPALPKELEPKSSASANSATSPDNIPGPYPRPSVTV